MKKILILLFVLSISVVTSPNQAKAFPYELNYVFSGTINDLPPYANVDITVITGGVHFTIKNLTPGNLDFDPDPNITTLTSKLFEFSFNYKGSSSLTLTLPSGWSYTTDPSKTKADGDGTYDYLIQAATNIYLPTYQTTNLTLEFDVSGDNNPNNFYDLSTGGAIGAYHYAAHIGALHDPAGNSAWVGDGTPIPEPATMLLLGSGLLALAGFARRKYKK